GSLGDGRRLARGKIDADMPLPVRFEHSGGSRDIGAADLKQLAPGGKSVRDGATGRRSIDCQGKIRRAVEPDIQAVGTGVARRIAERLDFEIEAHIAVRDNRLAGMPADV